MAGADRRRRAVELVLCGLLVLGGCARAVPAGAPLVLGADRAVTIPGLGPCDDARGPVHVDPGQPVVVLVHGCHASAGRFRALSRVFAFHGQQALCFAYDDRARLSRSARELGVAVQTLSQQLDHRELLLLGHSQGGLVARLAVTDPAFHSAARLRLVTVSAPFNGIRAAKDCGATWLHVLSLGTTMAVCRFATGAKWNQIHPKAQPVLHPGALPGPVQEHLQISTDERNTCRLKDAAGQCLQDDFVFSLAEQENERMTDARMRSVQVAAGHAEIVGTDQLEPLKLIRVLQEHAVMRATPRSRQLALAELLRRLF